MGPDVALYNSTTHSYCLTSYTLCHVWSCSGRLGLGVVFFDDNGAGVLKRLFCFVIIPIPSLYISLLALFYVIPHSLEISDSNPAHSRLSSRVEVEGTSSSRLAYITHTYPSVYVRVYVRACVCGVYVCLCTMLHLLMI